MGPMSMMLPFQSVMFPAFMMLCSLVSQSFGGRQAGFLEHALNFPILLEHGVEDLMVEAGQLHLARHAQQVELLQDPGYGVARDEAEDPEHDDGADELAPGRDLRPGLGVAEQGVRR